MQKSDTLPERRLENILNRLGLEVVPQYRVGKYFIDCYCPEIGIGFEYDGPWHSFTGKRDVQRDEWIEREGSIKVVRIKKGQLTQDYVERLLGFK